MKHLACLSLVVGVVLAAPAGAVDLPGKEVFEHYCTYCHGAGDAPGTVQLSRTRGKQRALLTERSDLTRSYIEYVVRHGLKSMPPFAPSDLTDAKLEALAAFLARK